MVIIFFTGLVGNILNGTHKCSSIGKFIFY